MKKSTKKLLAVMMCAAWQVLPGRVQQRGLPDNGSSHRGANPGPDHRGSQGGGR